MKYSICEECNRVYEGTKKGCCKIGSPFFTRNELLKIEKEVGKMKVVKKGNLYQFKTFSVCPLNINGCIVKNNPLACNIYPFMPTKSGWVIRTSCPYWDKFTKEDLRKTKREFESKKEEWKGKV